MGMVVSAHAEGDLQESSWGPSDWRGRKKLVLNEAFVLTLFLAAKMCKTLALACCRCFAPFGASPFKYPLQTGGG